MIFFLLHQGKVLSSFVPTNSLTPQAPQGFPINPMDLLGNGWHDLRERYTGGGELLTKEQTASVCNLIVGGNTLCGSDVTVQAVVIKNTAMIQDVAMKMVNEMRLIDAKTLIEQAIEDNINISSVFTNAIGQMWFR